LKIENVKLNVI